MQGGKGQMAQRQTRRKKKLEIGCVVWFYYIAVWGGRMYDTATVINAEYDADFATWFYEFDGSKCALQRQILNVLKQLRQ